MKLVYLHGIGNGDPERSWLRGLNDALAELGMAPLGLAEVVAPSYTDVLVNGATNASHPKITYNESNNTDARLVFERRQAKNERLLRTYYQAQTFGFHRLPIDVVTAIQDVAVAHPPIALLQQVTNYLSDKTVRAAVLSRILGVLPASGDIVLVGHSLGSVIAIDILDHLPPDVRVRRFITVGSPAGSPALHKNHERILKRFPYSRVDDWTNVLDPRDVVTAAKPLSALFPAAQDVWISGAAIHEARLYLRHPAVAALIGRTMRPGKEVVHAASGLSVRLTDDEATSLLAIEFANTVAVHIDDQERAKRYEGAVTVLRDHYAAELKAQSEGRPLAPEIALLASGQMPSIPRRWNLGEAIALSVLLSYTNLIAPHEIDVDEAASKAIPQFMVQLGFPSGTGKKVRAAVDEVNEALSDRGWAPGTKTRIAIAAAGVALLAAGPVGIAMAAGPGLAGAAAMTSGLAAFGPGGMAGGLALASGLGGTGGMVAAAAATVRGGAGAPVHDPTSLAIRIAVAKALKDVGEPHDEYLWQQLTTVETELSVEYNRLVTFSDVKSPGVKRVDEGRKTVERLQKFVLEHGLVPDSLRPALALATVTTPSGAPQPALLSRLRPW